jgi:PAS domain S-box-containing protein
MNAFIRESELQLMTALDAAQGDLERLAKAVDCLAAPIYLTDLDGVITHFNEACIGFTGRTPVTGKDRWCVTWKLYTDDGRPLPHDQCPMAVTVRTGEPVRGVSAVAERPDGVRVNFVPLPTPVRNAAGELVGAVNVLIDVTDLRQAADLRAQAFRCRRLCMAVGDDVTRRNLTAMAEEYEAGAEKLLGGYREA